MSVASWILLVWLALQLIARIVRFTKKHKEPAHVAASSLGCATWFAGMIYLIYLSGGWN